ncbi:MAG TPA: hypothetical protein VHM30_07855 [Gemmatimonadaceae bacterium]|nr:hypothetical protein [Gemmatimonadaceae bacterium]
MRHSSSIAVLVLAAAAIAACDRDPERASCMDISAPGVTIQIPPIDLTIRDDAGRGRALDTRVVVWRTGTTDSLAVRGTDSVHVQTGFEALGPFTVRVSRPFYRDTTIPNVIVQYGDCHLLTTKLAVALHLASGAPPVRSVGIMGGLYLFVPGDRMMLAADVDANPGLPTTVTWRSSDTTLATIDAAGMLTAKCTTIGGPETVTAISTADTTVRGTKVVGVLKQAACS